MYNFFHALSVFGGIGVLAFFGRNFKLSVLKSSLLAIFSTVVGWFMVFFLTWVENGFKGFGAENGIRAYSFFIFAILMETKIFKVDIRKNLDFQTFAAPLSYGLSHYGCIFAGCCHGFKYEEGTGMYKLAHALTGTDMLPFQFIESTIPMLIVVLMWILLAKKKYNTGGRLYFVELIIFGGERFLFDFLRDNEKIVVFKEMAGAISTTSHQAVWGFSSLSFWAISMVVEGIIGLIVINYIDKKKSKTLKS